MSTSTTNEPALAATPSVHSRAIVVDGHCDTPYRLIRHNLHLGEHDPEAQLDLQSLRESGITASFFAAYVPPFYAGRGAARFAYRVIDLIHDEVRRNPDVLTFCNDSAGIRQAKAEVKPAFIIGSEVATPSKTRCRSCATSTRSVRAISRSRT